MSDKLNEARDLLRTGGEEEAGRLYEEVVADLQSRLEDAESRLNGIKALRVEMVDLIGADLDATLQGLLWPKDVEKPAQLTGKTTPIRKMELHAELFDPPPE